jgi:hypothetical protein
VHAEDGLGSFQAKLAHSVDNAHGNVVEAAMACEDSNTKKAKKRLQQAGTALTQYAQRPHGHAPRKLDPGLQQTFLREAQPIADHLKSFRKDVQCPADAAG